MTDPLILESLSVRIMADAQSLFDQFKQIKKQIAAFSKDMGVVAVAAMEKFNASVKSNPAANVFKEVSISAQQATRDIVKARNALVSFMKTSGSSATISKASGGSFPWMGLGATREYMDAIASQQMIAAMSVAGASATSMMSRSERARTQKRGPGGRFLKPLSGVDAWTSGTPSVMSGSMGSFAFGIPGSMVMKGRTTLFAMGHGGGAGDLPMPGGPSWRDQLASPGQKWGSRVVGSLSGMGTILTGSGGVAGLGKAILDGTPIKRLNEYAASWYNTFSQHGVLGAAGRGIKAVTASLVSGAWSVGTGLVNNLANAFSTLARYTKYAALGFAAFSIHEFAKFDDALMRTMARIGDFGQYTRKGLTMGIFDLSSKSLSSPASMATALGHMSAAGMGAGVALRGLVIAEDLAVVSGTDLIEVTKHLVNIQNAAGLSSTNVETHLRNMQHISDLMAASTQLVDISITELANSLNGRFLGAMRSVHMSLEDGIALIDAYAAANIHGADAGTRAAMVLTALNSQFISNLPKWKALGINIMNAQGNMRPMHEIIGALEKRFAGMSESKAHASLMLLGFTERTNRSLLPLLGMSEGMKTLREALSGAGPTAKRMADLIRDSFGSQLQIAGNNIRVIAIMLGHFLAPAINALNDILKHAVDRLKDLQLATGPISGVKIWRGFVDEAKTAVDVTIGFFANLEYNFKELTRWLGNEWGSAWTTMGNFMAASIKYAINLVVADLRDRLTLEILRTTRPINVQQAANAIADITRANVPAVGTGRRQRFLDILNDVPEAAGMLNPAGIIRNQMAIDVIRERLKNLLMDFGHSDREAHNLTRLTESELRALSSVVREGTSVGAATGTPTFQDVLREQAATNSPAARGEPPNFRLGIQRPAMTAGEIAGVAMGGFTGAINFIGQRFMARDTLSNFMRRLGANNWGWGEGDFHPPELGGGKMNDQFKQVSLARFVVGGPVDEMLDRQHWMLESVVGTRLDNIHEAILGMPNGFNTAQPVFGNGG